MRCLVVIALVATAVAALAPTRALAQNAKAHKGAAERAIVKERWCEAVFLYAKLDDVDPNPEWALQAADAAQFADDRARALSLYKSALQRAPKHPRARAMEQSIGALEKLIAKSGSGTACGAPTPECGNGVVEGSETCDDGNRSAGDSCPATCTGTAQSAKPVTGLPPPPVVVVPPVVPVKPTVPVVTPPPPPPPPTKPVVTPPPPPPPPPPTTPAPTLPVQRSDPNAGGATLCTLIKPVKAFVKGDWKTFDFGSTLTIKSVGPQWTMIETPAGEGGKVAASVMEGACGKEEPAPAKPAAAGAGTGTPPASTSTESTPLVSRSPDPIKFDDGTDDSEDDESKRDVLDDPPPSTSTTSEDKPKPTMDDVDDDDDKEPDTKTIEPLRSESDPAAEAPEVEDAEGGGIGGWLVLGAGALFTVGGGAAAVWGALPYFEYQGLCGTGFGQTDCPALRAIGDDYKSETNPEDRANLADDAADLRQDVDNAAQAWDEGGNGGAIPTGRFVMAGGIGAAGLGVGLMVTGLIIALSGGEEAVDEEEESE